MKKLAFIIFAIVAMASNIPMVASTYSYVDLGLPSGTLWATTNIGASSSTAWGSYFSWGCTTAGQRSYISRTTQGSGEDKTYSYSLTKYNTSSNYGTIDNLTTLQSSDDAATQIWGSSWCIPTKEQWEELFEYCTSSRTQSGSSQEYGALTIVTFTGPNGNTLILPDAGYYDDDNDFIVGVESYWANSISSTSPIMAYSTNRTVTPPTIVTYNRWCKMPIRPVSTTKSSVHTHIYSNGFCFCGDYQTPTLSNNYYEIANAGELYWFASKVNSGSTSINGKLTANIIDNSNVLTSSGALNGTPSRTWTPIGISYAKSFSGKFDGGGFSISGLYYDNENNDYVGLFGYVVDTNSDTPTTQIKNVILNDSYLCGGKNVGGICGVNSSAEIFGCTNYATINGYSNYGGIAGANYGKSVSYTYNGFQYIGSVHSCANFGIVASNGTSGSQKAGGIVGYQSDGLTFNCYNRGSISSESYVGGIVGYHDHDDARTGIYNCYSSASISGSSYKGGIFGYMIDGYAVNCYLDNSKFSGNAYATASDCSGQIANCISKASSSFSSGEIAYLLTTKADSKVDATVWKQNLSSDSYPVLDSTHKTVYLSNTYCCTKNTTVRSSKYSNTSGNTYTNSTTSHASVAATCTTAGNTAYYTCNTCGKLYTTSDCTTETTLSAATITALGHSYTYTNCNDGTTHKGTCSRCSTTVNENHTYSDNVCSKCSDVGVTSVTMSTTSSTLLIGETTTLIATIAPTNATVKTTTWSSSDESVLP